MMDSKLLICVALAPSLWAAPQPDAVDFNREIRPILSGKCFLCHGPDGEDRKGGRKDSGGLRLDTEEGSRMDLGGFTSVVPGDPAKSELYLRVTADDEDEVMPPPKHGKPLDAREVALLKRWIEEGGKYAKHWAYEKPVRPPVSEVKPGAVLQNPIDHFVAARLQREGLSQAPEANRRVLARRVALDLTGLPPSLEEVEAYVADSRPDAHARYVDAMLAKPAFGEHWARMWLDLARYADSSGYADDPERTIWAFRDYVIRSLNADKPFDKFTIEQLAGDLLENPTEEQLVATAFHRNTQTNNEGGTDDEEFRNVAIVDRVNTTMAVWMGTTMACAQCHTHKYDPITQQEYFSVFAILNNTADADRGNEAPVISMFTEKQVKEKSELQLSVSELETRLKQDPKAAIPADVAALRAKPEKNRSDAERARLAEFDASIDPAAKALRAEFEDKKKRLAEFKPETTVPVMTELADTKRRKTHIQLRGNFLNKGIEVSPGIPTELHPLSDGSKPDRLTLAKWLVDKENPLTARVIANRYWEALFGIGIVSTSEDFGSQGEPPTHPQLLDWLAVELIDSGWDIKHLLRLIANSATYRQSAQVMAEQYERDPENRLLARGPRFRISAEMVRDQALAVSGLLSTKMYGPPVKPLQPELGLKAAFGGGTDWKTSAGEDRHRRGLYTSWRRSNPYASMSTFDAPNREVCTVRRDRTNTPLQALVTLNDPVYIEAAQGLARKIAAFEGDPAAKAARGFRLCLVREPTAKETAALVKLYTSTKERYAGDKNLAMKMATDPIGPLPAGADATELAAWTLVANALMNLDEMFLKP